MITLVGPVEGRARETLAGRMALLVVFNVLLSGVATYVVSRAALTLGIQPSLWTWAVAILLVLPVSIWTAHVALRKVTRVLSGITDGVRGLREADFSLTIAEGGGEEVASLARAYNEVGNVFRLQRNEMYQKELLLDTILARTPIAVILINAADRIVYSNVAARQLIARGGQLDGRRFGEVEEVLVPSMREALAAGGDALFVMSADDHEETFRVSQLGLHLNTQRHRLVLVERLTPELRRQEVNVWKRAIRIMNHELNNSLAPLSSLFHSARLVQSRPDQIHRLDEIYAGIEERIDYLRRFLEGYAEFARLPQPRKERVPWNAVLEEVRRFFEFRMEGPAPESAVFDRAQMQQVLINLLKNAHESGSDPREIVLAIERAAEGTRVRVMDRGAGMREEIMRQALLPFYSTKPGGTGLGLALSSEIIDAHGGNIRLQAREGGGTIVTCWLPT